MLRRPLAGVGAAVFLVAQACGRDALPGSNVRDGLAVRGEDVHRSATDVEKGLRSDGLR